MDTGALEVCVSDRVCLCQRWAALIAHTEPVCSWKVEAWFFFLRREQINVIGSKDVVCWESGKDEVKLLGFIYTISHNLQATAWLKLVQASSLSEMGDDCLPEMKRLAIIIYVFSVSERLNGDSWNMETKLNVDLLT